MNIYNLINTHTRKGTLTRKRHVHCLIKVISIAILWSALTVKGDRQLYSPGQAASQAASFRQGYSLHQPLSQCSHWDPLHVVLFPPQSAAPWHTVSGSSIIAQAPLSSSSVMYRFFLLWRKCILRSILHWSLGWNTVVQKGLNPWHDMVLRERLVYIL